MQDDGSVFALGQPDVGAFLNVIFELGVITQGEIDPLYPGRVRPGGNNLFLCWIGFAGELRSAYEVVDGVGMLATSRLTRESVSRTFMASGTSGARNMWCGRRRQEG